MVKLTKMQTTTLIKKIILKNLVYHVLFSVGTLNDISETQIKIYLMLAAGRLKVKFGETWPIYSSRSHLVAPYWDNFSPDGPMGQSTDSSSAGDLGTSVNMFDKSFQPLTLAACIC